MADYISQWQGQQIDDAVGSIRTILSNNLVKKTNGGFEQDVSTILTSANSGKVLGITSTGAISAITQSTGGGGGLNEYSSSRVLNTTIGQTLTIAASNLTKIAGPNANNSVGDIVYDTAGTVGIITTAGSNVTITTITLAGSSSSGLNEYSTTGTLTIVLGDNTIVNVSTLTKIAGPNSANSVGDIVYDSTGTIGLIITAGTSTVTIKTITIVGSGSSGGLNEYSTTGTLNTGINGTKDLAVSTLTKIAGPNSANSVGDLVFDSAGTVGVITTKGSTTITVTTKTISGGSSSTISSDSNNWIQSRSNGIFVPCFSQSYDWTLASNANFSTLLTTLTAMQGSMSSMQFSVTGMVGITSTTWTGSNKPPNGNYHYILTVKDAYYKFTLISVTDASIYIASDTAIESVNWQVNSASGGSSLPTAPTTAGSYGLRCVVNVQGNASYNWETIL